MERIITFNDIKMVPLPTFGGVIVSVTRTSPAPIVSFVDHVGCDDLGPMDRDGDPYMYAHEITHWASYPDPIIP